MVEVTVALNFIMKMYVSSIFNTDQYLPKEMLYSSHEIIPEFTPMYVPKSLEKASTQALTQLCHWTFRFINSILQNLVTKSTDDNNLNLSA